MIIFLYGQDTYRLKQKFKEIIEHYRKTHKSGLNLRYFDGAKLDFQDFRDEFRSISMLGEKKLMVLQNIISNKDFQNKFSEEIKKFAQSANIILFCQEGEVPANAFFKALKKHGKQQEFQLLESLRLRNWVKKEFERQQANVDKKALNKLIDLVGNNLWQMSNEIKKLADYGIGRIIEVKDIELLVRPKIETDIFKTIDAIALRDKRRALSLIHKHLEKGDSHLYLLAMIGFQFRNLLIVKSGAKLKMHPYVIKKTTRQAEFFSFEELKKIYRKIFQADLDIKTGRMDPDSALDLFISGI
jgi:DNA polymerase-3 subunit delta